MNRLLLALAVCLFTLALPAQVVINEICASNLNGLTDGDGDREDWFELYNSGAIAVNLSGWFLSDDPTVPQKWVVPNGQTIGAGAYRTIFCSGKDKIDGTFLHTNFKITQTDSESVVLTMPNGTTSDSYTFGIPNQRNHSYGRSPNGGPAWKIFTFQTAGADNNAIAYSAYAPDVLASQDAGFYAGSILVSLSTDPGFAIRYTTNGNEPTVTSTLYSGPLNITATTVLKARAYSSDPLILPGFVTANTYFINVNHTVPVVSIAGDFVLNLLNGTQTPRYGSFEYFENNLLETEGYGELNKHGNDSWSYPQRGIDWITRDQMGYTDELKHQFFEERTRKKFQRLILKAAANDNYPTSGGAHIRDSYVHTLALHGGLNVDVRTHLSCVLYVNGQYWGVYDMREKVDDADFTKYYYDQDEFDIDYIKTWGPTWEEYGSWTDWYTLKSFILGNNMANAANYAFVQQQLDFLSLIDYIIINQHSVCKDWLNWNTSWWRGRNPDGGAKRWRYTLWDMDATFGHYINYTGIPNIGPDADPCDIEQLPNYGDPEDHIDIFMALYNNPNFKALYINRYADLLNTSLSCAYMNALLDSMTNTIAPEMAQHCTKWGGTVNQWNLNVDAIHDFINTRCQVLAPSIVDCYDVTGPFGLTVNISPAASPNQVMVNTITPTTYPFVGQYFGGVNMDLVAKPAPGWQFDHWEVSGNTFGPDQYASAITMAFQTSGVVTAFFVPIGPCTPPTGVTVSSTSVTPIMDWTYQSVASSYLIQYRKVGDPVWTIITTTGNTWNFNTLPGCTQYEGQIQSICPLGNSAFVDFAFSTPDQLLGFALGDAVLCNAVSTVLDATVPGATYQWNDGSSAPTLSVTTPGNYWVTLQLNGCTSTDTAQVSLVDATAAIQAVLCPGETFVFGGETFDAQNPDGQVIFPNMATSGCDSVVQVSLQFLAPSQSQVFMTNCNPGAVGVDTVLLTNAAGCDSLVITTTTLAPSNQTFLTDFSCNPAFVGTDTVLLANQFGCDSLVITNTSFDASAISITPLFVQNCDPAAVGVDTVLLTNVMGCDSLVITTTTLAPSNQTFLTDFSCNPAFLGTDTVLLTNQFGCDSLVITNTSFDASAISITPLFVQNCDPAAVGVDTVLLTSVAGCDSLVITTTTLAPSNQTFLTALSCDPNLVGMDSLVLSNQFGCDSLVITSVGFAGLDFEASVQDVLCFGETNGRIEVDTVFSDFLPVKLVLENLSDQFYIGNPLQWEDLSAGIYSLLAYNPLGCMTSQTLEIAEANELYLDLGQGPLLVHLGDRIWANPQTNFQIVTAEWSPSSGVHCPSCPATFISAPETAAYTLTAFDENGCSTSASITVQVDQGVRVYVPNALRPGSGGPNSDFIIFGGPEVERIRSLQLFDRWGNKLFEQKDLAPNVPSTWDGTFRGKLIQTGVLVWMATVETIDGRVVNLSGDITVLR
ncbi:MAG: CotH kinase family protein [Bacteroidetes bacterium]|nr:CotH kinase family protein [Bacteroidota bacterium]